MDWSLELIGGGVWIHLSVMFTFMEPIMRGILASPASSGCLQLSNDNVIELFDEISVGTHLFIQQIKDS